MYPSTSLFIAIGQSAIVILVLFSYPLQVHPCRNCLDKVFHAGDVLAPAKPLTEDENDDEEEDELEDASVDMTPLKHSLLTAAIITSGFAIAYFVDDLQMGNCRVTLLSLLDVVDCFISSFVRGVHRIHHHLVYTPRVVLLEGDESCSLWW